MTGARAAERGKEVEREKESGVSPSTDTRIRRERTLRDGVSGGSAVLIVGVFGVGGCKRLEREKTRESKRERERARERARERERESKREKTRERARERDREKERERERKKERERERGFKVHARERTL